MVHGDRRIAVSVIVMRVMTMQQHAQQCVASVS
jgi:hypothetical protein